MTYELCYFTINVPAFCHKHDEGSFNCICLSQWCYFCSNIWDIDGIGRFLWSAIIGVEESQAHYDHLRQQRFVYGNIPSLHTKQAGRYTWEIRAGAWGRCKALSTSLSGHHYALQQMPEYVWKSSYDRSCERTHPSNFALTIVRLVERFIGRR